MTDEEVQRFGNDIAVAIRARGQGLADAARVIAGEKSAALLLDCFNQAAEVAEVRTLLHRISKHEARRG